MLVLFPISARAQEPPPQPQPQGVVGTIGLDGTIDKFYSVAHTAVVKTADGLSHLVHLTNHTAVHGTEAAAEAFHGLNEGAHVVVHYIDADAKKTAVEIDRIGDGGLHVAEGEIVGIDRAARQLIVELPDDTWITLRMTDRAAHDVGKELATRTRVVVYYANENGALAAHYFKKVQ